MSAQLISCYKIQGKSHNSKSQFLSWVHWDYFYCATENGATYFYKAKTPFFLVKWHSVQSNKGFADKISGTRDVI